MKSFTYQNRRKKDYFEGWYTRLVNKEKDINYAVIFAITKNEKDPHAFIQFYDGIKLTNTYYRFDLSEFSFENNTARIGDNSLSPSQLQLETKDVSISVEFLETIKLDKYLGVDSAMSYMKYFPLVCFQEVNFMNGLYEGVINNVNQKGTIYMEKTYGYKFPKKWIWIQGNNFDTEINLSMSCGYIPIFGLYQKGFFAVISYKGKTHQFGSYNLSRIKITLQENGVKVIIRKRRYKLVIEVLDNNPVKLVGPTDKGNMNLEVLESINATGVVTLYKGKNRIVQSKGTHIGFENMY